MKIKVIKYRLFISICIIVMPFIFMPTVFRYLAWYFFISNVIIFMIPPVLISLMTLPLAFKKVDELVEGKQ